MPRAETVLQQNLWFLRRVHKILVTIYSINDSPDYKILTTPIYQERPGEIFELAALVQCLLSSSMSAPGRNRNDKKEIPSEIVMDGSFKFRFVFGAL